MATASFLIKIETLCEPVQVSDYQAEFDIEFQQFVGDYISLFIIESEGVSLFWKR